MNLHYLDEPQKLLDAALSRARKNASNYPKQKTIFYSIKGKEIVKIDTSATYLEERLFKAVKEMPSFENLEPFYRDLYECIIDTNELRKNLASITSIARIIKNLRRENLIKLKEMRYERGREKEALKITNSYIGRLASLMRGLAKPIEYYNDSVKKLKELPSIKTNEECVIIAGLPNVGKSTLLKKITESKPEIASYPFTTKGLNVGVFHRRYLPIQVIDTPGLLDRPLNERNKIEQKAIAALQHLQGTIIFAVDPTDDLKKQRTLFSEIKKLFSLHKFLIVSTKADITNKEKIDLVKKEFDGFEVIIEGTGLNNLKERLLIK